MPRSWLDYHNPIRGLTLARVRALLDAYPQGMFAELMWTFGAPYVGVESSDPDLIALIEHRTSRLLAMDWDVITAPNAGASGEAQAAALRDWYDKIDNLYEVIEHLALAAFRGFALAEVDAEHNRINCVAPWNVARDGSAGDWYYNPTAAVVTAQSLGAALRFDPTSHWLIVREVRRPIGPWALLKFFYASLAAADWARFCDIFGIPGGVVIGPPNVPAEKEKEYQSAAESLFAGANGFLPNGSDFKPYDSPRGTSPYRDWLNFLSEKLVLAGTGGALTMLTAPGSGTLAGGAHADTFDQIAQGEARKISELLQRHVDRRVLTQAGLLAPKQRPLAWFALAAREETDTAAIIAEAASLSSAGYQMSVAQLSEKTGYELTLRPAAPALPATAAFAANAARPEPTPAAVPAVSPELVKSAVDDIAATQAEAMKPWLARIDAVAAAKDPVAYDAALRDFNAALKDTTLAPSAALLSAIEDALASALVSGAAAKKS